MPVAVLERQVGGVLLLQPKRVDDSRGSFSEVWNERDFAEIGIDEAFVQDNHVSNIAKGTVRGLHYQIPPKAQGKLLRVTRGSIFDVVVDIRRSSQNFGSRAEVTLSAANWYQLWIPPGFAHGYCTLEEATEVQYKVTEFYSPEHERGLIWDDPMLAIEWPFADRELLIADRDHCHPRLRDQSDLFD